MAIERLVMEIDFQRLSFADRHKASGAIAILEAMAADGLISLTTNRRTCRSDKLQAIQPQTLAVLDALAALNAPSTARQIADTTGVREQSVRPQLHLLLKHGRVAKVGQRQMTSKKKPSTLWMIVPRNDDNNE